MLGLAATAFAAPSSLDRAVARPATTRVLFVALLAVGLVPVLTTPIPAMVDYVNHLARMYELAAQGTPKASPFYHVDWQVYPNLAMDLIVPAVARWTGVELAARLFLLVSQLLVVSGSLAIERQVKGRTQISGFVAVLFLFNPPFAWGFLNFEAALGVALWGIAAWLAMRESPWPARLVVHALFVVALFAGHMFALGLYGATLGLHELWRSRRDGCSLRDLAGTGLMLAAPAAVLLVCMAAMGGSVGGHTNEWGMAGKLLWPLFLLNGDDWRVSAAGFVILLAGLCVMAYRREIALIDAGAWIVAGFSLIYLAIPQRMFDTAFADVRVLVGAVFILPAFVSIEFRSPRAAQLACVVGAGLTMANVVTVECVWQAYQPIYRDIIASFGHLPVGAHVLVAHWGDVDDPPLSHLADYPLYHAPTLAVPYAGAFVPTLFTTRGKQPLVVSPDLARLTYSCGGPVPLAELRTGGKSVTKRTLLAHWASDFQFVYVLGTPTDEVLPTELKLVEKRESFALYRVAAPAPAQPISGPASP